MLDIRCEEYLSEVREQASDLGVRAALEDRLTYLAGYACRVDGGDDPERTRCVLMSDFAPLSFYFEMQLRAPDGEYMPWFNGGCIFHKDEMTWSVHT